MHNIGSFRFSPILQRFIYICVSLCTLNANYYERYWPVIIYTGVLSLSLKLLGLPFPNVYADWNSFIINYNKNLYINILSRRLGRLLLMMPTGCISQTKWHASNLTGSSWNVFALHNHSDVRSVLPSTSQKCIYVGGINVQFKPGKGGKLCMFACLTRFLIQTVLSATFGVFMKMIIYSIYKVTGKY